ncbi:MAG TPA: nuclear transport factor 2 family protein [Pyrinomonadaceae bacterium]|nr:nuclear transport factor 2 family protein [Pyrinomonadaceae bacterium]
MQKIFLLLNGLCVICGFVLVAAAQDKTVNKADLKQLEAIYREYDAATKKGDLKIYEKYLDKTFQLEQKNGQKVSRREVFEMMKRLSESALEITETVSKIEKVRAAGGNYFLEVSTVMKGKFKMPDGGTSNLEIRGQSTDVWIKTAKGWKEIAMTERSSKILIDGKEAPM